MIAISYLSGANEKRKNYVPEFENELPHNYFVHIVNHILLLKRVEK